MPDAIWAMGTSDDVVPIWVNVIGTRTEQWSRGWDMGYPKPVACGRDEFRACHGKTEGRDGGCLEPCTGDCVCGEGV